MKTCHLIPIIFVGFLLVACGQSNTRYQTHSTSNAVAEANLNLGIGHMRLGNNEKALQALNKAMSADPDYHAVYNALGLLYQRLGKTDQAEQYYKRGIRLKKSDSSLLNNYGLLLCKSNRYEEAVETLLKSANNPLNNSQEVALTNIAICSLNHDRADVAEEFFRTALKKNPRFPNALIQMSDISYNQGKYLSARGYLQRYLGAVERGQTPISLWLGIRIERELGDKDVLASYILSLKNNFPDSEEAHLLKESGYYGY